MPQHGSHCLLNVDWMPARILSADGAQLRLERDGRIITADLTGFDWLGYQTAFETWLTNWRETEEAEAARRRTEWDRGQFEREELKAGRQERAAEQKRQDRLWRVHHDVPWRASGDFYDHIETGENRCYATADELETEVILVDLEDVDAELIAAVDCERSRLMADVNAG